MSFLNLWALFLIIPIVWLFRDLVQNTNVKKSLSKENTILHHRQSKLLLAVLFLAIIALSRPVLLNTKESEKFAYKDYILAIDASFSMQADDLSPTRFQVAKKIINELLQKNIHDRFTLFAFTTNPLLISPPTSDKALIEMALENLNPKYILSKGTSIKNLLKRVEELPMEHKELIIFSDGGEESNVKELLKLANNITINVVATASSKGSTLKKDAKNIYDSSGKLVISRINPLLKMLAVSSGGKYYEFDSNVNSIVSKLLDNLSESKNKSSEKEVSVVSFTELYYYPLLLALLFFVISVTKFQNYFKFLTLLIILIPNQKANASVFDFYYLNKAKEYYVEKNYVEAAWHFRQLTPSQESYLNCANSYYLAGFYKNAMLFYEKIKTKDPQLKQKIFYGMGNCAVKLKKYDRAKTYYRQALALGFHKDIYENLKQLYELELVAKINVTDMLPTPDAKEAKNSSKKLDKQQDSENKDAKESGGSSSNNQASSASDGASSGKKIKNSAALTKNKNYKMGYKAYELINEGYTNEDKPW